MSQPILSVIMPCYNVSDTLERAVDSILMQRVSFSYEIIMIDDASTDGTWNLMQRLASENGCIRLYQNPENRGNAKTFYRGLCAAQGDFFCVLDGDDYYLIPDKFQRQIDFFRTDVHEDYVATCHHFIYDLYDGTFFVPTRSLIEEFSYTDFIMQRSGGYYHTTTYMYRNIFRGNVPLLYNETIFRGDTPRTTFHLLYSNKKVKVLNFVGSAYVFEHNGIWSSMQEKKQFEYQINYLTQLRKTVKTDFERENIDKLIARNAERALVASTDRRTMIGTDLNTFLTRVASYANDYAFSKKDYILRGLYNSEYLDSLCASVGAMYRLKHPECVQREATEGRISIVIGILNPQGGGIFREITELFAIHAQQQIQVLVTNMDKLPENVALRWSRYPNVRVICPPSDCEDKLGFFFASQKEFAPARTYFYCSHNDAYAPALMQPGSGENVTLFSFDQGFILGVSASFLDSIVAKRPVDYALLRARFGDKVRYVPTWNVVSNVASHVYIPFHHHDTLITACCTARFYKVDGAWPYCYMDYVVDLLKRTGGKHYHIGTIPEDKLALFHEKLRQGGVEESALIYVPWVDSLPEFFLNRNIDVFIEPFPSVSYKATLDMLSCGVPVISFEGHTRIEKLDFIYPGALKWRNEEEFLSLLTSLTPDDLKRHSELSLAYFKTTHSIEAVGSVLRGGGSFVPMPECPSFTDDRIRDVKEYAPLFGDKSKIIIMYPEQAEMDRIARERTAEGQAKLRAAEAKRAAAEKRCRKEIDEVRRSYSYRAGSALLWLPKYIKTVAVCLPKKGFRAFAARESELYPERITLEPAQDELDALHRCASWRLGRVACAPMRVCKKMYRHLRRSRLLEEHAELRRQIASLRTEIVKGQEFTAGVASLRSELDARQTVMLEEIDRLYQREWQAGGTKQLITQLAQRVEKIEKQTAETAKQASESVWAFTFNNAITDSTWLENRTFAPGRWAIGYPVLYALYRTLNEVQPKHILELGLGQSTRMIAQYARANPDVEHCVVEYDASWIEYFSKNFTLPECTKIQQIDYEMVPYAEDEKVRVYRNFGETFKGRQFDLIFIDAPTGDLMKTYSRIDVLLNLPDILEKRFIIFFDDVNRTCERNSLERMKQKLEESGIRFHTGFYRGNKMTGVIVSEDLFFLTTL